MKRLDGLSPAAGTLRRAAVQHHLADHVVRVMETRQDALTSAWVSSAAETLRKTPLHDRHAAAGAKLVPFAGWEMPVQYEGIRQEHLNVRTAAGVFDVSHMGEVETFGPDAERFLQHVLSNDVTKLAEGGAQYSVL